jgi:predicted flap endonuclease-1-like 5' DNA nuclease
VLRYGYISGLFFNSKIQTLMIFLQVPLSQNTLVAILEALLLMALAAYIGWWLARRTFAVQIDALSARISAKEHELADCRGAAITREIAPIEPVSLPSSVGLIPGITGGIAAEPLSDLIPDDLKVVEGIGPKIEELLHDAGIRTFGQLAIASPERINEILHTAGPRFQIHDPATWPQQATLARDGQWDELKAWQDALKGGKTE